MSITFYAAPFSSALPVACALAELGVPHERVSIDLASGAQKKPEFLALNPNAKVPTLVADGTPMFEALAIVQWLGDRFGVAKGLWPAADAPARMTALAWSAWTYVSFAAEVSRLNYAISERVPAELHHPAQAEHARNEMQHLLGLVEARLTAMPYMLGAQYSLVDLLLACMIRYAGMCGVETKWHRHVQAWLERCHQRPALSAEWGGPLAPAG
jgi:glutathione S-transferase